MRRIVAAESAHAGERMFASGDPSRGESAGYRVCGAAELGRSARGSHVRIRQASGVRGAYMCGRGRTASEAPTFSIPRAHESARKGLRTSLRARGEV